jgi:protein-disulfide isomerase
VKRFSFFTFFLISGTLVLSGPVPVKAENNKTGGAIVESLSGGGQQAFSPAQVEQIKKVVHDYLVESPEVLIEVSNSLQEKQMQKAKKEAEKGSKSHFKKLVDDPKSPVIGNPAGEVVLVEFLDYQCGHCKTMSAVIDELIKKNKDLKVVIKELPIFGESSEFAAKSALAAIKQGEDKFIAFHQALFNSKARLSEKIVLDLAKSSKLDVNKLREDMESSSLKQELADNVKLAQELKLMGTPAFMIANKDGSEISFVPGAMPNPEKGFQELIEKARKAKK